MINLPSNSDFIELYVSYIYSKQTFPEGREQFSFSYDYDNSEAVVFGGISTNNSNKIWKFNPEGYKWGIIENDSKSIYNRYGHTSILYKKNLYIFGGKARISNLHMFQDLDIFDMENKTWIFPNINSKMQMKLRRGHIAILIGNIN